MSASATTTSTRSKLRRLLEHEPAPPTNRPSSCAPVGQPFQKAITDSNGDPARMGCNLGTMAKTATTASAGARAAVVAARLPSQTGPPRAYT